MPHTHTGITSRGLIQGTFGWMMGVLLQKGVPLSGLSTEL